MSGEILLKVITPQKKVLEKKVAKLQIPADKGKLTILPNRAPSEILLQAGILAILAENAEVLEEYQIGIGMAEVAGDVCMIYTSFAQKLLTSTDF